MKTCLLVIWIVTALLAPALIHAQEGPGSTGAGYLNLTIGAKSFAMGEAGTADLDDPFGWFMNPGNLQRVRGDGVGLYHSDWIFDTSYDGFNYYHRFNDMFVMSCGLVYLFRADIQGYSASGAETERLKSYSYDAVVGLGLTPAPNFTVGTNLKFFRESLGEWAAGGFGLDLGALYTFPETGISLGVSLLNLGPDIEFDTVSEPLPMRVRFGVSHSLNIVDDRFGLLYAVDIVHTKNESLFLAAGVDFLFYDVLSARIGYNGQEYRAGDGLTLGAGVLIGKGIRMDYAHMPYGDLGSFNMISISVGIR